MTDDPLSELNRRLFEAAHAERPPETLRERLLQRGQTERGAGMAQTQLGGWPTETERGVGLTEVARSTRVRKARAGATLWLLAAAVIGSLMAIVPSLFPSASTPEVPLISPERQTNAARVAPAGGGRMSAEPEAETGASLAQRIEGAGGSESVLQHGPARAGAPRQARSEGLPPSSAGAREPASVATPSPTRATLAEELEWLKRARGALRSGDPARAIELLKAYESELGGSDLRDEASVLHIEALAAAGRHDEASVLAERFASQNPNSPLVDRARSFMHQSETPTAPKGTMRQP
jgi:hypothetical protein